MHVYTSHVYIQRLEIINEMYNFINVQYSFGTIVIVFHKDQFKPKPMETLLTN